VIGGSAGGFAAIEAVCRQLPADFAPPIFVVQHLHASDMGQYAEHLGIAVSLPVVEARDKMRIARSHIYVAPANYHLLIEDAETLALSIDPPVYCSRPAIDALFESAARIWGEDLVAVLLSGASRDGTAGLRAVKEAGGHTFAQDPDSAEAPLMPRWAIQSSVVDEVLTPAAIGARILALARGKGI
jgi:two-component system chemotaxis response regulator CheB